MADVRSPIPVRGLSWELLCALLGMRVMCSEIAGNALGKVHLAEQLLAQVGLCAAKECRPHSCVVYQTWKFIMRTIILHRMSSGSSANLDLKSPSHCRSTSSICRWTDGNILHYKADRHFDMALTTNRIKFLPSGFLCLYGT